MKNIITPAKGLRIAALFAVVFAVLTIGLTPPPVSAEKAAVKSAAAKRKAKKAAASVYVIRLIQDVKVKAINKQLGLKLVRSFGDDVPALKNTYIAAVPGKSGKKSPQAKLEELAAQGVLEYASDIVGAKTDAVAPRDLPEGLESKITLAFLGKRLQGKEKDKKEKLLAKAEADPVEDNRWLTVPLDGKNPSLLLATAGLYKSWNQVKQGRQGSDPQGEGAGVNLATWQYLEQYGEGDSAAKALVWETFLAVACAAKADVEHPVVAVAAVGDAEQGYYPFPLVPDCTAKAETDEEGLTETAAAVSAGAAAAASTRRVAKREGEVYTISGTVGGLIDEDIAVVSVNGTPVNTAADGKYSVVDKPAGTYTVKVEKTVHDGTDVPAEKYTLPAQVIKTITTSNVTANFTLALKKYTIQGTVQSNAGGVTEKVAGALVKATDAATAASVQMTTGTSGTYAFTSLIWGHTYNLAATKAGLNFVQSPEGPIEIDSTSAIIIDFNDTENLKHIQGQVAGLLDTDTALVKAYQGDTVIGCGPTIDKDGTFDCAVYKGKYLVKVESVSPTDGYKPVSSYKPSRKTVTVKRTSTTITANLRVKALTFTATGIITKVDKDGITPLGKVAGAVVKAYLGACPPLGDVVSKATSNTGGTYVVKKLGYNKTYCLVPSKGDSTFVAPLTLQATPPANAAGKDFKVKEGAKTISGKVKGLLTGDTVNVCTNTGACGTTNSTGLYTIEDLNQGTYTLHVEGGAAAKYSIKADMRKGEATRKVVVKAKSKKKIDWKATLTTWKITGKVTKDDTTVVGGAVVTATDGTTSKTATTNSKGLYTISNLPGGVPYAVTAAKSPHDFRPVFGSDCNFFVDHECRITALSEDRTVNFNSSVKWKITGAIGGLFGTQKAKISISPLAGTTPACAGNGDYEIANVPNGTYTISAVPYATADCTGASIAARYTQTPAEYERKVENGDKTGINFNYTWVTHNLTGSVKHPVDGVALSDVLLTAKHDANGISGEHTRTATSNSSGNYTISGLRYGVEYTITPTRVNHVFVPTSQTKTLTANGALDLFTADRNVTTITGKVQTQAGVGIQDATVRLQGTPWQGADVDTTTLTAADGTYTFSSVRDNAEDEKYTVSVTKVGYTFKANNTDWQGPAATQEVLVRHANQSGINFYQGHAINATVQCKNGGAAVVGVVLADADKGPLTAAATSGTGTFSLTNLKNGDYTFTGGGCVFDPAATVTIANSDQSPTFLVASGCGGCS